MPEPKGTAKVGLVQKRAGYDLCKNDFSDYYKDLIDNLFVPMMDETGEILLDERGQYLIEE
jgi:hypothetical protein